MILLTFPGIRIDELQKSSSIMTANINGRYISTLQLSNKKADLSIARLSSLDISDFYARIRNLLVLILADKEILSELTIRENQFVVVIPHTDDLDFYHNTYIEMCKNNSYNEGYIVKVSTTWYELIAEIKKNYTYYELPIKGELLDSMDDIYKLYDFSLLS